MSGLGIRSVAETAPIVFVSATLATLPPLLVDTRGADGRLVPGFLSQLNGDVGSRSFDFDADHSDRLRRFCQHGSRLSIEVTGAWTQLRDRIYGDLDAVGLSRSDVSGWCRLHHSTRSQRLRSGR